MKSILVVDDEKLIRWALREALRKSYDVHTAASGDDALALLERVNVDAVLTDLKLPGMNGGRLVEVLREQYPEVKIFTLSAHAGAPMVRHLREHVVLECFGKPFDVRTILDSLDRHLRASQEAPLP